MQLSRKPRGLPWTAVTRPLSPEYGVRREALLREVLGRGDLVSRFAAGRRLPRGYGIGFDERVVEYPWLLAAKPGGRMLDAGSALNHECLLDSLLPRVESLTITTLAPEPVAYPHRHVSYVYADLRELPFRDCWFDTVACISTLEHVGMDNGFYGVQQPRATDPDGEMIRAAAELRRVLAPGGLLLVSVPYGAYEDHGWFRQFNASRLDRLVAAVGADRASVTVFRYRRRGWQRSDKTAAAGERYHDVHATSAPAADLAAAARAVACVRVG